jgi:hypothetical protein
MTNRSHADESPDDDAQPKPPAPPRPKRGAFPSPESERDKGRPYTPDADEEPDR